MKRLTKLMALVLVAVMLAAVLTACPEKKVWDGYTYQDYTSVSPSNWCELTYQDANDTQIMNYISSSFFGFDYKFDANGKIVSGEFTVVYEAATKLEDLTAELGADWGIEADKGQVYRITLRDGLKWQNGDPITAHDFVYTMKEQLDPAALHYRANSYYKGTTALVGAQTYVNQGQTLDIFDNSLWNAYEIADLVKGDDGVYTQPNGEAIYFALGYKLDYLGGKYNVATYANAGYLDKTAFATLMKMADDDGNVPVTDETIALWTTLINTSAWGNEGPEYLPMYLIGENFVIPEVDFSTVGIYAESDNQLVVVLANPLVLLNDDGSLNYHCAYDFSSLPLVHKATWERCKVQPTEEGGLVTTTYNSSKETTMSWGPFYLDSFQAAKQYVLMRNDNWYGYALPENEGFYQTDRILCETIKEWNTAWVKFKAGEIDGIGIDVSISDDYKNSARSTHTPSDFVGSLQLQSSKEALKDRESEGVNKTILTYRDFRKALSISINRADYTRLCTTSSKAGFGLFNSVHYYDVANGGVYRNTDVAKQVLCDVYAVDVSKYDSLDDAVAAITGFNLEEARALVTKAYNEALAAGDIKETDDVVITFGTANINAQVRRNWANIQEDWLEMFVGTPLDGRVRFDELECAADSWADDFRAGLYDVCQGGWQGAAWNPGYFLLAYLDPDLMYSAAWETSKHMLTFTMKGVGEDGADYTDTLSLLDWYNLLNNDWASGKVDEEYRLELIAAIEKEILTQYYSVPMQNSYSASLLSFKVDYITTEYNTFMGYGGMKYMKYNYKDSEWKALLAEYNNDLSEEYKK